MNSDADRRLIAAVATWFRLVVRREKLEPHERRLFQAFIEWKHQLESGVLPTPPKNPELRPPPLPPPIPKRKSRHILPPPRGVSGTRRKITDETVNQDAIPTMPTPPKVQKQLIEMSKRGYDSIRPPKKQAS